METAVPVRPWPVWLIAALAFINGLFAILEILLVRFSPRLEALLPFDYEAISRNLGLFAGFALIYFSGRLLARKRLAWWIAFVASAVIVVGHILYIHRVSALIIPGVSLILLAAYRDEFQVESEPITAAQGLRLFAVSLGAALAYGTIGFYILLRRDFGQDFSLEQSLVRTLQQYSLLGNADIIPRTREAHWFLDSLNAFGIFTFAFALFSLFRPLSYRYGTLPSERARARLILERYGRSSEDAFKLWPEDKAYFFGRDGDSFVAYRVAHGVAVALGAAAGPPKVLSGLLRDFTAFCARHDWTVSFLYLSETDLPLYERAGLRSFKIGEDAIVQLSRFCDKAAHNKHFRSVRNKFDRLGYRFEVVEPPQTGAVLREIAAVTRSWLKQTGRAERSFALGYHDRAYLAHAPLYLLRDGRGRLVAFANAIHSYNPKQATIDLMRYRYDAETGAMDRLLLGILEYLAREGWQEFSLGLVPLSGLTQRGEGTLEERLLARLARLNAAGFSFDGLRRYKDKFEPNWQSRYLVYGGGGVGLGLTALALTKLTKPLTIDKH